MNRIFLACIALMGLIVLVFSGSVGAATNATITYTGQLLTGGVPVPNGTYDFQFSLFTASVGGSQVGAALTVASVPVADGVYYVQLNFGATVFAGAALYIQTSYRMHTFGSSAYTVQTPRNLVPSSSYADYAALSGSTQALQGNVVGTTVPVTGQTLTWNGSAWVPQTPATVTPYSAGAGLALTGHAFSVPSGGITSAMLAKSAVTAPSLAPGAVTAPSLAAGSVTSAALAPGSVTSAAVAAGAIGTSALAAGAVTNAAIAAGSVTATDLAPNAFSGFSLAPGSVVSADLAPGAVSASAIGKGAVGSSALAAGAVTSSALAPGAVTTAALAVNSVTSATIANGAVAAADLAPNAVTAPAIASGAIGSAALAANSVTSAAIAAGAVKSPAIAAGAVGASALANGAVTGPAIALPLSLGASNDTAPLLSVNNAGAGPGLSVTSAAGDAIDAANNPGTAVLAGTDPLFSQDVGVFGESDVNGVIGYSTGNGVGAYGFSANGYGVEGESQTSSSSGIYGTNATTGDFGSLAGPEAADGKNTQSGVFGDDSSNGYGVYGTSNGGYGVYGSSANNIGAFFTAGGSAEAMGVVNTSVGDAAHFDASGAGTGIYATANSGTGIAGSFDGNVKITGTTTAAEPVLKIDHPLDPANEYLYHAAVQSDEMVNLYSGNVTVDANGDAVVTMPAWFQAFNKDFRYQLTCIGGFAPVYVAQTIKNGQFRIAGGKPGMTVSWQVTGVRNDAYANAHPLQVEEVKPDSERGLYQNPTDLGEPENKAVNYAKDRALLPPELQKATATAVAAP